MSQLRNIVELLQTPSSVDQLDTTDLITFDEIDVTANMANHRLTQDAEDSTAINQREFMDRLLLAPTVDMAMAPSPPPFSISMLDNIDFDEMARLLDCSLSLAVNDDDTDNAEPATLFQNREANLDFVDLTGDDRNGQGNSDFIDLTSDETTS